MDNLTPITRAEKLLAGVDLDPVTRFEWFLKQAGSGGGGGGFTPTTAQLAAMNSGITAADVEQLDELAEKAITTDELTVESNYFTLSNGIRVYVSATAPTGNIPDGSVWIGSGSAFIVDAALSMTSENPVQNKVIASTIGNINSVLEEVL